MKAVTDFENLLKKWKGVRASVYTEPWDDLKKQLASIRARGAIPKATKPAAARASAASAAPTPGATAGKGGGEGSSSKRKRAAPEQQLGTQGGSGSQDDVAGAARPTAVGQVHGKTVREWTKKDVSDWLLTIGEAYMQFQESFVEARVEGDQLLDIIGGDEEAHKELATALNVTSKIHRTAIIKAARGLRERC